MKTEDYEQEARYVAKKFYRKDWDKLTGKLRDEIYEMARLAVDMGQGHAPKDDAASNPFIQRRS